MKKKLSQFFLFILLGIAINIFIQYKVGRIYYVPTSSMMNTILPGDYVWVQKLFDKRKLRRNNIVLIAPSDKHHQHEFLLKRAVALPGDSISLKGGILYINGKIQATPVKSLQAYQFNYPKRFIDKEWLAEHEIHEGGPINDKGDYQMSITTDQLSLMQATLQIQDIQLLASSDSVANTKLDLLWPPSLQEELRWTKSNWGPILLPKKGQTIAINESNFQTLQAMIASLEGKRLREQNGSYYLGDQNIKELKFTENYYMILGDHRSESIDSRYFGPIAEAQLVGKAKVIVYSNSSHTNEWRIMKWLD